MLMLQLSNYKPGKNGLDKAKTVVRKLKDNFGLRLLLSKSEIIIRSRGYCCRKDELGVIETSRAEFRMFTEKFRFCFKCEGESGHLYPELFSEKTIRILMTAFTHPRSFDVIMATPKGEENIGILSEII